MSRFLFITEARWYTRNSYFCLSFLIMLSLESHKTHLIPKTLMNHRFINLISLFPAVVLEPLLQTNECVLYSKAHTKYNINRRNFLLPLKRGEIFHAGFFVFICVYCVYLCIFVYICVYCVYLCIFVYICVYLCILQRPKFIYSLYESIKEVKILYTK